MVPIEDIWGNSGEGSGYRLDAHHYNPMAQLAISNLRSCGMALKTLDDISERVMLGTRFKRDYVEADRGTPFSTGKDVIPCLSLIFSIAFNLPFAHF